MISFLLLVAAGTSPLPAAPAPADPAVLADAAHAIDAGRLEQARLMIGQAVAKGASGPPVQKLIADLAYASGSYADALAEYKSIAASGPPDQQICEKAAIAALKLGRLKDAVPFGTCATEGATATWKAWNVRGVIADYAQDWALADTCYARAHQLAPKQAEVVNNEGWSMLLRGDWVTAAGFLRDAAKLDPDSARIANNLDLATMALAAGLPARKAGESSQDWAARLNDAGVAAELAGDRQRAVAAFTQALYASDDWYARAANNLGIAAQQ